VRARARACVRVCVCEGRGVIHIYIYTNIAVQNMIFESYYKIINKSDNCQRCSKSHSW